MLALGLVETLGILPAIEAADVMLKAADVRLLERNFADGGLVTITVAGEVGAVKASVDAARSAVERLRPGGFLVSAHVIPRPDGELVGILRLDPDEPVAEVQQARKAPGGKGGDAAAAAGGQDGDAMGAGSAPTAAQLGKMGLERLRHMAHNMDGLPLSEDAIASADRKSLIAALLQAFRQREE